MAIFETRQAENKLIFYNKSHSPVLLLICELFCRLLIKDLIKKQQSRSNDLLVVNLMPLYIVWNLSFVQYDGKLKKLIRKVASAGQDMFKFTLVKLVLLTLVKSASNITKNTSIRDSGSPKKKQRKEGLLLESILSECTMQLSH